MADKRWIGKAQATRQVTTITASGTWATSDVARVTVGDSTLSVTIGAAATTTDVASALAAAINAETATQGLLGTESRNIGGQQAIEFTEFSAASDAAVVTLTGAAAGVPFTVSVSETTAGSGSLATATTTAATGPNHFDNAANWEGGSLPADGDRVIFDYGETDCLYGTDHLSANSKACNVLITDDFLGQIGLPATNAAGYFEYRNQLLKMVDGSYDVIVARGRKQLIGHRPLYLAPGVASALFVDTVRGDARTPGVHIVGGAFPDAHLLRGAIAVDPPDPNGVAGGLTVTSELVLGTASGQDEECIVTFGAEAFPSGTPACAVHSGRHRFESAIDGFTSVEIYGGSVRLYDPDAGSNKTPDVTVYGGVLYPDFEQNIANGVYTVFDGGAVDLRDSSADRNLSRVEVRAGGAYYDPADLGAPVIDLPDGLDRVTLDLKPSRRATLAAIP